MLYQQLKDANITALKQKDTNARAILSVLLNKIKLLEIEKRSVGEELQDADIVKVLQKSVKELAEEKEAFVKANRTETVEELEKQIKFVEQYLPKMLTKEEIAQEIEKLDNKAIPNVMAHFKKNFAGKCDMRQVQEVLKEISNK